MGTTKHEGPRSCGSAVLSWGMVTIPLKLYASVDSHDVQFNLLHVKPDEGKQKGHHARLKMQPMVCSECGEVVERNAAVKGYEHAKNQYVWFSPDELKSLEEVTENTLEISEFVPASEVSPTFFEKSHYLGPDKGAQKAYRLLYLAMTQTGRAAVAIYSTRGKQKLALVRAADGGLMLHTLYYADEVRSPEAIEHGEGFEPRDGELELAVQLVENLASDDFDPTQYEDSYRAKVLAAIEQKVAGGTVTVTAPAAPKSNVVDMMEALKASLAAAPKGKGKAKAGRKAA
jgi:DNA end-binding protein Ku